MGAQCPAVNRFSCICEIKHGIAQQTDIGIGKSRRCKRFGAEVKQLRRIDRAHHLAEAAQLGRRAALELDLSLFA